MLKTKQILRNYIILLGLNGMILASIAFSVTGCQAINLMNKVFFPRYEQKAKQNIGAIIRGQRVYLLENGKFSNSIEELGLPTATDSQIYSYRIHKGIQRELNNYQFLPLDKVPKQSFRIPENEWSTSPKILPRVSSDILMISARPKREGFKTFVGFIFTCYDPSTGGTDCEHESSTFSMLYESEEFSTLPPYVMKVALPLDYCGLKRGCLREKVPTPEGFRPVEETNRD